MESPLVKFLTRRQLFCKSALDVVCVDGIGGGAAIEKLILTGSATSATGNSLANTIIGNSIANGTPASPVKSIVLEYPDAIN